MDAEKLNIDVPLVKRLVASQFPAWSALPVVPVSHSGWDNRTFHLGESMSVRLPSAKHYAAQVVKEQTWLPVLGPLLPLPIPRPLVMGEPSDEFSFHWSIYEWLAGEQTTRESIADETVFAVRLAEFLNALRKARVHDGPAPGWHNFFRGGSLATYNEETLTAIRALDAELDAETAADAWRAALASSWRNKPVWVHGDVASGNLLQSNGALCAVIDFGCMAVGDPACDLTIAWTLLTAEGREAFKRTIALDDDTWKRAGGWALWKALITVLKYRGVASEEADASRRVIDDVLNDHKRMRG